MNLVAIVVVLALSGAAAQQEKPAAKLPQKGDIIVVKGCLKGSSLEATETGILNGEGTMITALVYRLTGDKDQLKQMRNEHDGKVVEVTGILKSTLPPSDEVRGKTFGKSRITVGIGTPQVGAPATAEANRSIPVLAGEELRRRGRQHEVRKLTLRLASLALARGRPCGSRLALVARGSCSTSVFVAALLCIAAAWQPQFPAVAPVREVAPGISLFQLTDTTLIDPPAPISIWMLRLDPARVTVRAALSNDEVMGTEVVADTAARHGAVAAVNAGFFLPNGDPAGVYKLAGRLVSDTRRPRGAVGITSAAGKPRLLFDRLTATVALNVHGTLGRKTIVPVDGVDTTRLRGKLMLFTPAYHDHTDTAPGGLEWAVGGRPPRVTGRSLDQRQDPDPGRWVRDVVWRRDTSRRLRGLKRGRRVDLVPTYAPASGDPAPWSQAADVIGGAGLLVKDGREITDWSPEQFNPGFAELRHPRTMIGVARDGFIWLVTVDGRQPTFSAGMTLAELQALARRLESRRCAEPRWRWLDDDVGDRIRRQPAVGRGWTEEGERRAVGLRNS